MNNSRLYYYRPDVTLVRAVLDVIANRFEHVAGRGHRSAVEHLKIDKRTIEMR